MPVCVLAVLALVAASSLLAPSCGNHAERQPAGYPCARDRDCEGHLLCVGGTCRAEPTDGPAGD